MREMTYGSAYLFERGARVMRKLGFIAAFREQLPDGRLKIKWVKD